MELFSLVLGAVVMFATPGYIALQIGTVVSARSQGWRVAALVPLLFAVPIAAWCLFALVQDSNLWPLPFILFAPVGVLYLLGLLGLRAFRAA